MTTSCTIRNCDRTAPTGLCRPHRTELHNALIETRDVIADLMTETTRRARHTAPGQSIGKTTDTPLLYNDASSQVLRSVRAEIGRWDKATADHCGDPVRHPNAVHALRYIRTKLDAGRLNTWPKLDHLRHDLASMKARAAKVIDNPTETYPLGYCTETIIGPLRRHETDYLCRTDIIVSTDTDEKFVTCARCRAEYSIANGRAAIVTAAEDQLLTAAECARAITVFTDYDRGENRLVDRIRQWHHRGRITSPQSITIAGKSVRQYRVGDVQALVLDLDQTTNTKRRTS